MKIKNLEKFLRLEENFSTKQESQQKIKKMKDADKKVSAKKPLEKRRWRSQ